MTTQAERPAGLPTEAAPVLPPQQAGRAQALDDAGNLPEFVAAPLQPFVSRAWERTYARALMLTDAVAILIATLGAVAIRFGSDVTTYHGVSYWFIAFVPVPIWVAVMAASRAYEARFLGVGSEEFHRVFNGAVRFTAGMAILGYAGRSHLARGFVALALPGAGMLTILGRCAARSVLHRLRRRGQALHRVLVVGDGGSIEQLVRCMRREEHAGFDVVGACLPGDAAPLVVDGQEIDRLGTLADVLAAARRVAADTIAVGTSAAITAEWVQQLSWEIEGSGIDLVVAPALPDVSAQRLNMRPVSGLPLLHIQEPSFTGVRRVFKNATDRFAAALALVLLSPVLAGIALAVRLTSRGPALFRQTRIGQHGVPFTCYKFRSMHTNAEKVLATLLPRNEHGSAPLFKMKDDPRVTTVGHFIRRFSLDELPQLLNVLKGDMSLVGPRPGLPREYEQYASDVQRRLLVKPGLTGLWQVSGRSDLPWDEAVRLDLTYVANWSPALDLKILIKTATAVLKGSGAY